MPFERAHWPDAREAIRRARAGEQVDFDLALLRYLAIPAPEVRGTAAVDACCGVGQGALILREKGWTVTAFDRHPAAADLLTVPGIECRQADFFDVHLPPIYSLVAMCDCLEHLPRPVEALRRARTWLQPGGRIFLAVPLEGRSTPNPYHLHAWDRPGLLNLLAASGLVVWRDVSPRADVFWGFLR